MMPFRCLCRRAGAQHEYSVYWVPRRTTVCDRVLEAEGLAGDVLVEDFPLSWVPLDRDLLSLELDTAFRVGCPGSLLEYWLAIVSKRCLHEGC